MKRISCERVRDLLPLQALGDDASSIQLAHAHLAACAECRDEAALVQLLREGLEPVPAGLEARVLQAVQARAPRRMFTPARIAMAATLAAAVIGGSALLSREQAPAPAVAAATDFLDDVAWDTEADPLLHGGSTLQQLSVEELELLLAELDR